jgi:superfamily II helicase
MSDPVLLARAVIWPGPAILAFVANNEDGVDIDDLGSQMAGPQDWIALARLLAAGLLSEDGAAVHATETGEVVSAEYVAMAAAL